MQLNMGAVSDSNNAGSGYELHYIMSTEVRLYEDSANSRSSDPEREGATESVFGCSCNHVLLQSESDQDVWLYGDHTLAVLSWLANSELAA